MPGAGGSTGPDFSGLSFSGSSLSCHNQRWSSGYFVLIVCEGLFDHSIIGRVAVLRETRLFEAADGEFDHVDETFVAVSAGFTWRRTILAGHKALGQIGIG